MLINNMNCAEQIYEPVRIAMTKRIKFLNFSVSQITFLTGQ